MADKRIKPDWDEFWLSFLPPISARASCDRGRSGALIVRDKRVISIGWVGSPIGLPSCDEEGHIFERRIMDYDIVPIQEKRETEEGTKFRYMVDIDKLSSHCVRTCHAELNAILNCAKDGISTIGATLYCSMVPCRNCAMAIIQAGIKRVVALNPYQKGGDAVEMFKRVGIELKVILNETTY